ncbi:MBL fold metallo-hydrolase [Lentibacillus sp. L22]|uniref:ComEC/Rec2 family competence protein n=1 Tax=Lentibacillus TaxID=175304 RepID=UPI0022B0A636|nr:MBL fold metallo-hydrolase [Lentibacillus daqui]
MRIFQVFQVVILLQLFFIPTTISAETPQPKQMKIHFIDVGQGDSTLIETPGKKNILIDAGPPRAGKDVVEFLKARGIKKIDLLIATHPDIDHIGGLPTVMKSFKIDKALDSGKLHSTKTYVRYINQIHKHKIPVNIAKQGDVVDVDPLVDISVLNSYEEHKNNNQSSIVLKVGYNEVDFLLMADAERGQEEQLMEQEKDVQSDIYKVGHHGSNTSTSYRFLNLVKPKVAILTYSKMNHYGHPVDRVVGNLQRIHSMIYSTAVYGDISIVTNGKGYFIFTEKSPMDGLTGKAG